MEGFADFCKQLAIEGMEETIKALSFVPDDKLTWTPTPTAKSAIRIAAHSALYYGRFAKMIRTRELPSGDGLENWLAKRNAEELALTTRAEIETVFRQGTEEVLAALDGLTPEEVNSSIDSGLGWSMPMTQLMKLPGLHALTHSAQLDYLQTCWDDQEVHF